jgi:hypothetical protein
VVSLERLAAQINSKHNLDPSSDVNNQPEHISASKIYEPLLGTQIVIGKAPHSNLQGIGRPEAQLD